LIPRPGRVVVVSFDFARQTTCDGGSANYLSPMSSLTAKIQALGAAVISWMQNLGKAVIFTATATLLIFTPPFRGRRIIEHLYFIGVLSILVVSLTAFFTGMVLGLQGYYTLSKFGSEGLLGSAVALSLIRELGPVLAALMVTGRAGSAVAANLGAMRISEQIDALDTMDIDPVKFLVAPRIAAAVIAVPLLTAIFDIVGIIGGYISGVVMLGVSPGIYISGMISSTRMNDIASGLIKPVFFGFVIAAVSCYRGYYCDRLKAGVKGSAGVSLATTSSVVIASVIILILDYVLTAFLL